MTFSNAIKLSFHNTDKAWKLVLYRLVVWAVIIGLMAPCFFMIKDEFVEFMSSEATKNFSHTGVFYSGSITDACLAFFESVWGFVTFKANNYVGVLIYYIFLLFILLPTLMNMGKYTINAMTYSYMSSHAKKSFCTTYIGNFGKSFVFGFFRALFNLVFNLSAIVLFYAFLKIPNEGFEYAMPYIFVILASLILTIKQLFVMGWAPSMIVCDFSSTKAFGFGIKTTYRRFGVSFVTNFIAYLVSIFLLVGFGVYSLIAIVPIFAIIMGFAEVIMFFGNHGMKYYIDEDTIISPKKHEELDKIKQIKFLL